MRMPRTDTKVFAMLECFAEHGPMDVDEIIDVMGNISWKATRSGMQRVLNDAIAQNYLMVRNGRYELIPEVEDHVFKVMELKSNKPKRELVASPYRNIWTQEMQGYTASLYRNKRGYEKDYK